MCFFSGTVSRHLIKPPVFHPFLLSSTHTFLQVATERTRQLLSPRTDSNLPSVNILFHIAIRAISSFSFTLSSSEVFDSNDPSFRWVGSLDKKLSVFAAERTIGA